MIKSQLIEKITNDNPHLYQRDIENVVEAILSEISGALINGDRVELRGFGAFGVKLREGKIARNPRTGEKVAVEDRRVLFFKSGKDLKARLNKNAA